MIPAGFSAPRRRRAATSAIEVVANVDSPIAGQVGRAVAGQFVGEINAVGTALGTYFALLGRAPEPGEAEALVAGGHGRPQPARPGAR